MNFIDLSKARAWLLDHFTLSLPVPTVDVVFPVSIESIALEQMVTIHPGMATSSLTKLAKGQGDFRLRRLGSLISFLVDFLVTGDLNMTWDPLTSVDVLLLKTEIAAWESMRKTTFAGANSAKSDCVVDETSPYR
ncbi:hypothetical protein TNCV_1651751 [Trichonephila clavipes]|nr:hypothetical protein TNCV_1651751 [Trichonephila clavipes]